MDYWTHHHVTLEIIELLFLRGCCGILWSRSDLSAITSIRRPDRLICARFPLRRSSNGGRCREGNRLDDDRLLDNNSSSRGCLLHSLLLCGRCFSFARD